MTDIQAIRERVEKATKGPWTVWCDDSGGQFTGWPSVVAPDDLDTTIIHRAGFHQEYWGDLSLRDCCANANFIARARTDIPFLISEIDRLNAVSARVKELEAALILCMEVLGGLTLSKHSLVAALEAARKALQEQPK
jgi:hypothetical protein